MGSSHEEVKINNLRTLAGSDEILPITPLKPCASCKSDYTVCIYADGAGSIVGYWSEQEFKCLDCGMYSVYFYEYDS